jgi:transcriptional regulator with PAS, ATPase and Fis domain
VIVGRSPSIRRALTLAERYAHSELPILLLGATGTGKEVFANHIHILSGRQGELVDVNCAALPRDMVESLLFGHARGAFTGAVATTTGLIEQANGGTLLLDEVDSLPFEAQAKLLRVIETGELRPLGARFKRRAQMRVVSAAQPELRVAIGEGRFRLDLFQRLAGAVIELAPLAERPEDVLPLAEHFAALRGRVLEPGVDVVLLNYPWPGNVRELKLAIERAGLAVSNGTLPPTVIAEAIALGSDRSEQHRSKLPREASPASREELLRGCVCGGWRAAQVAAHLGISRRTLFRRLREVGLSLRGDHRECH